MGSKHDVGCVHVSDNAFNVSHATSILALVCTIVAHERRHHASLSLKGTPESEPKQVRKRGARDLVVGMIAKRHQQH